MYHEANDAHHGSISIVHINSTLEEIFLLVKRVSYKFNCTIAEVTNKLSSLGNIGRVLHHKKF